jgi:hypothetical protein
MPPSNDRAEAADVASEESLRPDSYQQPYHTEERTPSTDEDASNLKSNIDVDVDGGNSKDNDREEQQAERALTAAGTTSTASSASSNRSDPQQQQLIFDELKHYERGCDNLNIIVLGGNGPAQNAAWKIWVHSVRHLCPQTEVISDNTVHLLLRIQRKAFLCKNGIDAPVQFFDVQDRETTHTKRFQYMERDGRWSTIHLKPVGMDCLKEDLKKCSSDFSHGQQASTSAYSPATADQLPFPLDKAGNLDAVCKTWIDHSSGGSQKMGRVMLVKQMKHDWGIARPKINDLIKALMDLPLVSEKSLQTCNERHRQPVISRLPLDILNEIGKGIVDWDLGISVNQSRHARLLLCDVNDMPSICESWVQESRNDDEEMSRSLKRDQVLMDWDAALPMVKDLVVTLIQSPPTIDSLIYTVHRKSMISNLPLVIASAMLKYTMGVDTDDDSDPTETFNCHGDREQESANHHSKRRNETGSNNSSGADSDGNTTSASLSLESDNSEDPTSDTTKSFDSVSLPESENIKRSPAHSDRDKESGNHSKRRNEKGPNDPSAANSTDSMTSATSPLEGSNSEDSPCDTTQSSDSVSLSEDHNSDHQDPSSEHSLSSGELFVEASSRSCCVEYGELELGEESAFTNKAAKASEALHFSKIVSLTDKGEQCEVVDGNLEQAEHKGTAAIEEVTDEEKPGLTGSFANSTLERGTIRGRPDEMGMTSARRGRSSSSGIEKGGKGSKESNGDPDRVISGGESARECGDEYHYENNVVVVDDRGMGGDFSLVDHQDDSENQTIVCGNRVVPTTATTSSPRGDRLQIICVDDQSQNASAETLARQIRLLNKAQQDRAEAAKNVMLTKEGFCSKHPTVQLRMKKKWFGRDKIIHETCPHCDEIHAQKIAKLGRAVEAIKQSLKRHRGACL